MDFGRSRKRLKKLARRYSDDELRKMVYGDAGDSGQGILFLSPATDGELRLNGWHPEVGAMDVIMDDDVKYFAVCDYLQRHHLIFESCDRAARQMRGTGPMA